MNKPQQELRRSAEAKHTRHSVQEGLPKRKCRYMDFHPSILGLRHSQAAAVLRPVGEVCIASNDMWL